MRRALIATLVASAAVVPAASAKFAHAPFWQNKARTVDCGYLNQGSTPTKLLCSAKGIPRPAGSTSCDPGFVVLGTGGKPQPIVTCQDEFPAGTPTTLKNGTRWRGLADGIACTIRKTVTCRNAAGRGFTIGNGKYKPF